MADPSTPLCGKGGAAKITVGSHHRAAQGKKQRQQQPNQSGHSVRSSDGVIVTVVQVGDWGSGPCFSAFTFFKPDRQMQPVERSQCPLLDYQQKIELLS